jgi:hypothetical protein
MLVEVSTNIYINRVLERDLVALRLVLKTKLLANQTRLNFAHGSRNKVTLRKLYSSYAAI